MTGQIGTDGQVSIATNPTDGGRTMTVVFNDLGSILRFLGTYPQLQGGAGSFVLAQNTETKVDTGSVNLKNFAIVDEKNHSAVLTEDGIQKCEKLLGIPNLYDDLEGEWVHHITQGLRAHHLYQRGGRRRKLSWGIRYQDRCAREAGAWRYERRELLLDWAQDLPLESE